MVELCFELLYRLLWGSFVLLFFVSRRETSERFLKIWWWISAGISCFILFLSFFSNSDPGFRLPLYSTLLLTLFSVYCFLTHPLARIFSFVLVFSIPLFFKSDSGAWAVLNFVSGGLLLGSIFMGQYLGHWYLNVANLRIRELQVVVAFIIFALLLKSGEVGLSLYWHFQEHSTGSVNFMGAPLARGFGEMHSSILGLEGRSGFGLGFFGLLILLSRVLWGIVAPWILVFMVRKTVQTRSTQSATGILYALCVMVLIGEGCALFLLKELNWLI